jgi:hypothetical protein
LPPSFWGILSAQVSIKDELAAIFLGLAGFDSKNQEIVSTISSARRRPPQKNFKTA